ncbi:MAG: hypothetical protein WBA13_08660 [Microcoleaceae cyanobacterium]
MTTAPAYPTATDVSKEDYIVLGLATCFVKEDGEVEQVKVIEPIPSAALEALMKGIPTSYEFAFATTVGAVLVEGKVQVPSEFPADTMLGEDFAHRTFSAARTFKQRPTAQTHIPLGTTYNQFNYSLERKRVLNSERVVSAEDNVKQHAYTHQVL